MGQKEITREIRKYFEMNENENTMYQNLWDAAKTVLRGKFRAVNTYIKKERSQINNLIFNFKKLEKKSKLNSKQAVGMK